MQRMSKWLFSGSIFLNAILLSLLALVGSGPFVPSGEHWEGLAFNWLFSLPLMLVLSLALSQGYANYRSAVGTFARVGRYVAYVLLAALGAPALTVLFLRAIARVPVPGAP
jgi:hypothetical protein